MKGVPIKFRGKNTIGIVDSGFIYGDYVSHADGGASIRVKEPDYCKLNFDFHEYEVAVNPDTVAQLVGYDANGNEVYEGDKIDTGIATFNVAIHPSASYACHVDISKSTLVKENLND